MNEGIEFENLQKELLKEREERRILESDFTKQKAEFDAVFQNLADAYLMMDISGRVYKMSNKAKELLGYDIDVEKFNLMQIAVPGEINKITTSFMQLLKEGILTNFRSYIKTKDNTIKYVQVNASIIYDENNKPVAAQGIVRDITESHEKRKELAKSEKRLATLVSNRDTGVVMSDENCKILLINDKVFDLFGLPKDGIQIDGQECLTIAQYTKELYVNSEEYVNRVDEIIKNREPVLADELIMKSGRILERDFTPIVTDNVYDGHLWTFRDVTLKKRYDKNIKAEKFKYESIINNTNLGLIEVDKNGSITTVNKSLLKMYNFSEDEILGKDIRTLFNNAKVDEILDNIITSTSSKQPKTSFEFAFNLGENNLRSWLVSVAPNYNINGELVGYIGAHLDVTHLKRLEHQKDSLLKKLAKSNEELQDYAHMVSHDLKAPLRNMDTLITWFKEDYKEKLDTEANNTLNTIRTSIGKMEHLIKGILVYSSLNYGKNEFYNIDLNKLIDEISTTLYIPVNARITFENKLPVVKGDKYRFVQLFQNLIHNAVEYNDKKDISVHISCEDIGSHWKFCVEDNGPGIENKYLKKIFEVFQKLDNEFNSSGLGLSIVKKIVEVYEGEVYAESTLGKGTKILFTLKKY